MTARELLPNRRRSETIAFRFRGAPYTVTLSRFNDSRLAEIFVDNGKCSTHLASDARDAAVALSIAMQYGVPPEAIRAAVTRDADGSASGIIGAVLDTLLGEVSP
jgi:fructose-specific phosphotransferase system IIC component